MKNISRRKFIGASACATGVLGVALSPGFLWRATSSGFLNSTWEKPVGDFCHWSFGGQAFTSPVSARSMDFQFRFKPVAEKRTYSFREEVLAAAKALDGKRNGKPLALCYSGGTDSELLGMVFQQLGIPFEMYFLDMWGLNQNVFRHRVQPMAARWNKDVRVVKMDREYFTESYSVDTFLALGCESPTYLALTYLFSQIPTDQYIVTGDGDLDRRGSLFAHIGQQYPVPAAEIGQTLAFSTSAVVYENWAQLHQRPGAYYFFRSTPGLVAAAFSDPLFQAQYPFGNTKDGLHSAFPEIRRRAKTTNWEGPGLRENRAIRSNLERFARWTEGFEFWHRLAGTTVKPGSIFRA